MFQIISFEITHLIFPDITCCKTIRITSGFQHENMDPSSEIFQLQKTYPRVYENQFGDTITRNGGICGLKEDTGYWMV